MDDKDNIQDILTRLVRIETKLDDFANLRQKSENAYSISMQNSKDIGEIQTDLKHVYYAVVGLGIAIIGFFAKVTLFK
ncbi:MULTISPECIES: hemolysin XhlA family protein [Clostridium]|uniref:hemolysin XhlA family protein n=1 Tax=Clostridium TaxID=1485 RepID=UPI0008256B57|nr:MULTISPECIES: hemolysin XhlA family protein [Clostridium]PJI09985.1 hypothetical protein CUB90_19860 [Clostridium sp. CT7]